MVAMDEERDIPNDERMYHFPSNWVVLVRDPETGQRLIDSGMQSFVIPEENRIKLWTDDFSNIISLINWN